MSLCKIASTIFEKYIHAINKKAAIDILKDKPLRYNVWNTTSQHVRDLFKTGTKKLPKDKSTSAALLTKIDNALKRIDSTETTAKDFFKKIVGTDKEPNEDNISMAIALHEIIESVKGESDKARNLSLDINAIKAGKHLPALPLSRIAASIGRKILFQEGFRYTSKTKTNKDSVAVETLYYERGIAAIKLLEAAKYIKTHEDVPTIKDYLFESEVKRTKQSLNDTTTTALSLSLNEDTLGIKEEREINYFINRTESELIDTRLGVITDALRAINHIVQPSTIVVPDIKATKSVKDLAERDDQNLNVDPVIEKVRKKAYDNPLFIHQVLHGFISLLNKEHLKKGLSGSKIIRNRFGRNYDMVNGLFGIKRADNYSIDRKASVDGQNRSKTTPIDDIVENFSVLTGEDGSRSPLHLAMKQGRNIRLYYDNSVLNPHASKHSRYTLTPGAYTVDVGSADLDYLVYGIFTALGNKDLTYNDFVDGTNKGLEKALTAFTKFENTTKDTEGNLQYALGYLSDMARVFPGVDYVTLLTTLKGIQDIRNPVDGKVTTEFTVATDATASGGTITFMLALGTQARIKAFMQRLGVLKKDDGTIDINSDNTDVYTIMLEAIKDFADGASIDGLINQDTSSEVDSVRGMLEATLNLLFDKGNDVRDLSKQPTTVFIYGQERESARKTMANDLAVRIIDNLDSTDIRKYLVRLFNDESFLTVSSEELYARAGFFKEITQKLNEPGKEIPDTLFDIMNQRINNEFLEHFKDRGKQAFEFVKNLPGNKPFKILHVSAMMAGKENIKDDIDKYGQPITKVYEVSHKLPGTAHTVLTRKQRPAASVANVSTIHGIDAAQLYHAALKVMKDRGMVFVHDEARGTVQDVRAFEIAYREITLEIMKTYDIHEQIMLSVAVSDPSVAKTSEYKTLLSEIQADKAERVKILEESFNENTSAFIGDGDAFKEYAKNKTTPQSSTAQNSTTKTKVDTKVDTKAKKATQPSIAEVVDRIDEIAKDSPIVSKFLDSNEITVNPDDTDGDSYSNITDEVTVTGQDFRNKDKGIDFSTPEGKAAQTELLEHEIIHAYTVPMIEMGLRDELNPVDQKNMDYIVKALQHLSRLKDSNQLKNLSEKAQARVEYVLATDSAVHALQEFISIMGAETDVANELYKALTGKFPEKTLKERLTAVLKSVKALILKITDKDLEGLGGVEADKLQHALVSVIASGASMREAKADEFMKYTKLPQGDTAFAAKTQREKNHQGNLDYLNHAVASMLSEKIESNGKVLIGSLHNGLKATSPLYSDVADKLAGIYDDSGNLQELLHAITGNNVDKVKKAEILAKFFSVMQSQTAVRNDQAGKFHKLLAPLSKEKRAKIGRFVNETPLHDYFVLARSFKTEKAIAAEVDRLEKGMRNNPSALRDVEGLVNWNVHNKEGGRIYNLEQSYPMTNESDFGRDVRKLLVLKSIQAIGAKDFVDFLGHTDLVNLIRDTTVANRLSLIENEGLHKMNDSLVPERYKEPIVIEAFEMHELSRYENGENLGWKILEKPTKTRLGIVYKEIIDSSEIPGAYTDTKLSTTDIEVFGGKTKYKGVVQTRDGHKLRLTKKQKIAMGLLEDFSQGLVRGVAHNMAIQESQIIRDRMLEEARMVLGKDFSKLSDIIESDNVDNPWFIKMPEGKTISDLNPNDPKITEAERKQYKLIRAHYKPVGSRASDVKGFNEGVDLVRKDIAYWLIGGKASSLFQNPKYKWIARITKDLISGSKLGMVILNPVKITKDNVSNLSYLSVMGVPPTFIAKNYKEIADSFTEYSNLESQIIQLKVQLVARPNSDKIKKKINALRKRVAKNPLGTLGEKGFLNSLGSDLVSKNADTLSGFQADIHTALEYLLKTKEGKKNYVSHFILELQKLGFKGEDFLTYIGNLAKMAGEAGEGAQNQLDQVAERLKEIRTEEDIVNYVSQYTTSPSSEAVRLGASMTDLTDVMAKETLYRHLIENEGMTEEAAKIKVLDSFPDYKENMPLAVKQLSDFGIIMFPSFWLRIQKVIYRMARDKPINLATELMLEEAVDSNIETIVSSVIINKWNAYGGIFHTFWESIGLGSVAPIHIFG